MRQQKGKKIVLSHPRPEAYVLPALPTSHARQHPTLVQPYLTNQKKYKQHTNMQSLDDICLRECCKRKRQVYSQSVAEATNKKNYFLATKHPQTPFPLNHHPKRKKQLLPKSNKHSLTYDEQPKSKEKIYYLHNLKTFELSDLQQGQRQELQERQTGHKVRIDRKLTKLLQWRDDLKKEQITLNHNASASSYGKDNGNGKVREFKSFQRDNEEGSSRRGNDSYIQTDLVTSRTKQHREGKRQEEDDAKTNPTKRYYMYIENYQNSQEDAFPQRRAMNSENNEEKQSVDSYFKPTIRKENSTIFHAHKLKFTNTAKQSRVRSSKILSQSGLYKIPHTEDEQTQFLLNYKPLDPSFNVKALVGKENFRIVQQKDMIFLGLTKQEQKEGLGILLTQKEWFQGQFLQDEKARGRQKTKEGVYIGPFLNNKRGGHGKFTWANGQEFEGEWKKGKKDGHGIWRSTKGDFYQGDWKNNKQNGKGVFTHVGGSKYSGYFKDFLKHGRGEQDFANGDKYSGEYKYGKPHGFGRYVWANGDKYEGQFVQGSRQGKGTLTKAAGQTYQGSFLNDMKHGEGKQRYASGEYFEGIFQEDGKVRGKLYSKKGVVLQQLCES